LAVLRDKTGNQKVNCSNGKLATSFRLCLRVKWGKKENGGNEHRRGENNRKGMYFLSFVREVKMNGIKGKEFFPLFGTQKQRKILFVLQL
jgi:hypothetical protein